MLKLENENKRYSGVTESEIVKLREEKRSIKEKLKQASD